MCRIWAKTNVDDEFRGDIKTKFEKNHLNDRWSLAKYKWLFIGDLDVKRQKHRPHSHILVGFYKESGAKLWKIINWWGFVFGLDEGGIVY